MSDTVCAALSQAWRESSARGFTGSALGLLLGAAAAVFGCDGAPSTSAVAPQQAAHVEGLVRLSAKESLRVGVAVAPVVRSEFRTHREFPALVQPNQRAMAD
ncbi:MAG: hypothetical protein K8R65_03145, partial [Nitrospirae bacterium]|nr:hypothetical protein [Nitrospirota bacterium]